LNYTPSDIEHFESLGLSLTDVAKQLEHYKSPLGFVNLKASATIGKGIIKLSDLEINEFIEYYEEQKTCLAVVKFTPASGAASRMFKMLH